MTEKPMRSVHSLGDIAAYAEALRLIQRHTITILPSVSSRRIPIWQSVIARPIGERAECHDPKAGVIP